jgi:hypothetical protein
MNAIVEHLDHPRPPATAGSYVVDVIPVAVGASPHPF